ncbi:NADH-dependent flavin oxidoreductase [mine drainage metagenome]|uniref:NADH-dependent flavin oxidoreductase n=1 Tax=mine drainage metagenome TaxID=410659 RepID=T1C4K0_9ZZZZ
MCQYSAIDGVPQTWHLVHLGSRAVGGAGLVMTEATAVSAEARISPSDTGIWSSAQCEAWKPIVRFIREQGAVPGIQLAHAGRKASTNAPWEGGRPLKPDEGGWTPVAPSPLPFADGYPVPEALDASGIMTLETEFIEAAQNAHLAGFEVLELHFAHGYLMHEFLSPLSNQRQDGYGGPLDARMKLPLRIVDAVRGAWPDEYPLFVRLSVTDWSPGGWNLESAITFTRVLRTRGVDLVDCSSGGITPKVSIPTGPGYQTHFSETIRRETGMRTGAVGLITDAIQADHIIRTGQADAVFLARAELRQPYWPLEAASRLGATCEWPKQYARARPESR